MIWSLAFVALILALRRQLSEMWQALRTPRLMGPLAVSSVLIAINWIVFIYAAHTGRLVQASLGYFLTPLLSVLLGVALLGERLRRGQLVAIVVASVGVAIISYLKLNSLWIPLGLMVSFSLYGLLRKRIVIGPIVGLGVETAVLAPFALAYIAFDPGSHPTAIPPAAHALLVSAGIVTAIPLMLFAYAARRLRLITIGLLQYAGPTVQLVVARFVAHESISAIELGGFIIIWIGLILFSVDSARAYRRDVMRGRAEAADPAITAALTAAPDAAIATPLQSRA